MSSYLLDGSIFNWTFEVKNDSQGVATDVAVVFTYPGAGVTIDSTSVNQGTYNTGTDTWHVGTLGPGVKKYITIYGTVTDYTLQPFTATGVVSIAEVESNATDNILSRTVGSSDSGAACNITGACLCGTLPVCTFECAGNYEYRLVPGSSVNGEVTLSPQGAYRVVPTSDPADWSFQYTVHCCVSTIGCPSCINCGEALLQCSIAGSTSLDCTSGQCGSFLRDETGSEAPEPGETPADPPVAPKNGSVLIEVYDNLTRVWTYDLDLDTWTSVDINPCAQMQFCEPYAAVTENVYTGDLCDCTPVEATGHIALTEIYQVGGSTSREISLVGTLVGTISTTFDVDWGNGVVDTEVTDASDVAHTYAAVGSTTKYTITVSESTGRLFTSFTVQLTSTGELQWLDATPLSADVPTAGSILITPFGSSFRWCPIQTADIETTLLLAFDDTSGIEGDVSVLIDGVRKTTLAVYDSFSSAAIVASNAWVAGNVMKPFQVVFSVDGEQYASIGGTLSITC